MKLKFRKKLFYKIHTWIGIKLSILFFIVCFSGTLATISHELDWLFNPASRAIPQDTLASKNTVVANIKNEFPNAKTFSIFASPEPYLCDIAQVYDNDQRYYVFTNQYTGEVQGKVNLTIQRFFRDLHYYLFIPFQVGHFTVLFFGFILFISTVTACLFYKKWWKKLFTFKKGNEPVALFRCLHRLVGVWSVPFTILISITGMWYFLERANIGSISDTANPKRIVINEVELDSISFSQIAYKLNYDRIVDAAEQAIPNLEVKDIIPPRGKTNTVYVTGKSDVPLVRNRANRVYIHPVTYEVLGVQNAKEINTVTWLNDIADPLHYGNFGGLFTKIIWFVGGLGISFLIGTGIFTSLKREIKNAKKAKTLHFGGWKYLNISLTVMMFWFMYKALFYRYAINTNQFIIISLGWIIFFTLGWYIYVNKIKKL